MSQIIVLAFCLMFGMALFGILKHDNIASSFLMIGLKFLQSFVSVVVRLILSSILKLACDLLDLFSSGIVVKQKKILLCLCKRR